MRLMLVTTEGLEDITVKEASLILGRRVFIPPGLKGKVIVEKCSPLDVVKANYMLRTVSRVLILLKSSKVKRGRKGLEEMYKEALRVDWEEYFDKNVTFAVRPKRHGEHEYTSIDIGRWVGQAIVDFFSREIKVNLDNPSIIIRTYVIDETFLLCIDTTGDEALHKRRYRVYEHPSPLKPTMASSMLMLANWTFKDSLLDPFCGSGTIPIEACLYALKVPAGYLRKKEYSFWPLKIIDKQAAIELMRKLDQGIVKNVELKVAGCDISSKHVEGARLNAKKAGVNPKFFVYDARRIDRLKLDVDVVITNPPYGIRSSRPCYVRSLYRDFLRALKEKEVKRACIITGSPEFMDEAVKMVDFHIEEIRYVMYGKLPSRIYVLKS